MGSKKEKTFRPTYFDYLPGGRIGKMGEKYGIDRDDYNIGFERSGTPDGKGDRDDYEAAINHAASMDYNTNRSIEAAALSGKKKAQDMAGKGFNNIQDVIKANNMFEKMHARRGNSGDFSSSRDQAGLTYSLVERDREKQDRGYEKQLDNRFNQFKKDQEQTEAEASSDEPVELSARAQAAQAFGEFGFNPRETNNNESELIFGQAMDEQTNDASMGAGSNNNAMAYDPTKGESSPEAGSFLADHKELYKTGIKSAGITGRGAGALNF